MYSLQQPSNRSGSLLSLNLRQAKNLPPHYVITLSFDFKKFYLKKIVLLFLFYICLGASLLLVTGCSKEGTAPSDTAVTTDKNAPYETLTLRYQGWAGQVFFPELAEDLGYLAPIKLAYIGNNSSGPQDIQAVATNETDFGYAFNGAIVNLKSAGLPIKAVIAAYGSDENTSYGYFVNADSPIKTARDLIGKKIAVNALGAHSEFMIREYLYRNGLTKKEADQVELVVVPPVNSEQVLRAKQVDAAALNSFFKDLALERGGLRPLFFDTELFGPFTAGAYVVRESFIKSHPRTVQKFVEATAKAIEWMRTTPKAEVVARLRQIIAKRKRNENDTAIAYWKSNGVATKGGVLLDRDFQTWIDWLVREGRLKADDVTPQAILDNQFNPFKADVLPQPSTEKQPS